jgi:hypothetical protein
MMAVKSTKDMFILAAFFFTQILMDVANQMGRRLSWRVKMSIITEGKIVVISFPFSFITRKN